MDTLYMSTESDIEQNLISEVDCSTNELCSCTEPEQSSGEDTLDSDSVFHSSKIPENEKKYLPQDFDGIVYNMSYKWLEIISKPIGPIKYMEIGAFQGANVCSIMKTYASHPNSEVHCVDPWFNYDGYKEYRTTQETNYSKFLKNISKLDSSDIQKIYIHRDISKNVIPTFKDEYFDIIYVDGNHHRTYVLEDAVLAFRKLKPGGWIIFDDMNHTEVENDVQCFVTSFGSEISNQIITSWCHLLCQRKS